jgi:hypothetical protein
MNVCDKMMEPMTNKMAEEEKERMTGKNRKRTVESAVTTCAWALVLIWIGIALFEHVGWGAGLLGVGIIVLGAQVTRKYFALRVEVFWVTVGFFFVVGGVWELLNVQSGLIPILCIAVGLVLLVSTLVGRPGDSILK